MAGLKNHPGMWLRDDAAAAINALEDKYGVIRINSAGRTEREQQELIDRWNRGDRAGLYKPAMPASTSPHVRDGGIAVDVYNYTSDRAKLNEFGFSWYGPGDPVHYNFTGWNPDTRGFIPARDTRDVQRIVGAEQDGIYGPDTTAKVAAKQRALGVADDGLWGPATEAAYVASQAPQGRPSSKSPGELSYADIQEALNRKGYGLAVDNVWGPKSSAALADFQARNGLVVDRLVGPATWAKLNTF